MIIEISNKDDRRLVAGILVDNGYTVKTVKVKVKSVTRTYIEAEKEQSND